MSWLTPIGFLGLAGLIALIIIYIIKPNYQNKIITSTFIWKLSLKFRKKKIPINKLRNIILFICQVLAITAIALILAQPFIAGEEETVINEKVAIIDGSASMMAETNEETRFERAVEMVRLLATDTFEENGKITVILASDKASVLASSVDAESKDLVFSALDALIDPSLEENEKPTTYGKGDISGAIKLAENTTSQNPNSKVYLYTDTTYIDAGRVEIKDVKDSSEWNAAILDVRAILEENYYRFEVDVACYGGVDADIDVYLDIYGVNTDRVSLSLGGTARCVSGKTTTLIFAKVPDGSTAEELGIAQNAECYSFDYANVRIEERDSFEIDNRFELYGGEKKPLRIQYASSAPNNFFASSLMVLRDTLSKRWNVEFVDLKADEIPETEGFDFYIFEHTIPKTLPTDGVVILANPDSVPSITGLRLGSSYQTGGQEQPLTAGDKHYLIDGLDVENITVTQFTAIANADGYTPLMYVADMPVVMAKNEPDQKIVAMTFSLNYSNFSMLLEFPLFMYRIIEYYMPATLTEYVFEVNDSVTLNSRSEYLTITDQNNNEYELREFPSSYPLTVPGRYTVTQTPISNKEDSEYFFVTLPDSESNISEVVDTLQKPYFAPEEQREDLDLLLYFALALVCLLFAEWWLQSREQF